MITFISSTFYPISQIQKNALYCWDHRNIPFILIRDGVKTEKDLGFNGDSPIISDMIRKALPLIQTEMVAIINSDILIDAYFEEALKKIITQYGSDIFLTSVRRDIEWVDVINTPEDLEKAINSPFIWHQDASADLFISSKKRFEVFVEEYPEFIYGRLAWDNAIHVYFKQLGIPCFNTSESLKIYHQKHGYDHLTGDNFKDLQRNPGKHPSTNHNMHLFGKFMRDHSIGMSNIPRVKSSFPPL